MSKRLRILVVDDNVSMVSTLADILTLKGYEVESATSGEEALEKARQQIFDCVLSDIKMPGLDGVALSQALRAIQPDLPIVLMTAYASNTLLEQGRSSGVVGILEKPLDLNQIMTFLASLMQTRTIVIVDDDPEFCRMLAEILEKHHYEIQIITNPSTILETISQQAQTVLLDMKLDHITGWEVLQNIRPVFPTLPVLLITGYHQEMCAAIQQSLAIGAYACLYKPLVIPELLILLAEIRAGALKKYLHELA